MKKLLLLPAILVLFNCGNKTEQKPIEKENNLNELFTLMQGSFNSEAHAKADSTYYNISLHMYPIWETKGNYLYVEQALNSMQDKPYRQRIYEVKRLTDSTFASYIYQIPNDSLWIGKWKNPKTFDSISPKDIEMKKGCEVLLKRLAKNHYKGSTNEADCESTFRGAAFATSEVEISENKVTSWDRGFDANGDYVWGAEKGGYIFIKNKE